ncbi:hypothetical protein L249_1026 [Ophiocordyceps polyrhachis-furcata BCC 54312]|uniref:Uncharacterized protein n=1 Tax=Ophiocordyceps polyrhachis-furcata BCC 54312 TaxID=1330021 RepID=A0A367LDV6_9HYPO|nr:hypothetical protein L249_1026 [Ophiocordyceps polyrhachis-furcata BCC 54312]
MKHLFPALALALALVSAVAETVTESGPALRRQGYQTIVKEKESTKGCSRQNTCLMSLSRAFDNRVPTMNRFCDRNEEATTDEARDLSFLPDGKDGKLVRDHCTTSDGVLQASCACVVRNSTPGVKDCRRALEAKLGGADAVADFCYLATFGETQTAANPYNNRTVLTGVDACAERQVVVEVCQAAAPWNRRWTSPQCLQDDCYVAMEMLMGDSIQSTCKGMLAGRVTSITGFRLAGRHCEVQRQIQACRCVTMPEPEFGDSETTCEEAQCFQSLRRHFGRHADNYCDTVLDGHVPSSVDEPATPSLSNDARRLGCRYGELIEACQCMRPKYERQHPACAHDECYGAMEEYYEGSKDAIESYCDEARAMTPAESERDLRRYRFGPPCFQTAAVRSACACITTKWEAPACVADECYRGIEHAVGVDDTTTVFGFCRSVIRGLDRDPETALPGLGSSCRDTAALRKACDCVVPPGSRSVWLGNLGPAHCYRDSCFSSIDRSFKGDFHLGVLGFCMPTLRQLTLDAAKVEVPDGCADSKEVEEACFCALPDDTSVWTSPQCIHDPCYRRIDHGTSIDKFCKTWRRSQETTAVSPPTFPGLHLSCPGAQSISKACDCHQPEGASDWAEPKCMQDRCYASLDQALDQHPGVRRFCHELQWSQQKQLPPPATPSGLDAACASPGAVADACQCVVSEDVEVMESLSSGSERPFPVCEENACRSGLRTTLGQRAVTVCQALTNGTPLHDQGLGNEAIALISARCNGVEPELADEDQGRIKETETGPMRRRDAAWVVKGKVMAACQCILSQDDR